MPSGNVHAFFARHGEVPGYYEKPSAALMEFFLDVIEAHPQFFSGDVMEIGTYEGRSARHLAMHVRPGEKLHLCDPYHRTPDVAAAVQAECAGEVRGFYGFSSQISPADIADRSVRFAYLDGEHGRHAIMNDIALADRVLRAEGIVVADDFLHAEFMGVTIGLIEWLTLNPGRLEIILAAKGKAVLCRPGFTPYFIRTIRDDFMRFMRECDEPDWTLSRGAWPSDCVTVGLVPRRFDLDVITRDTDFNDLEAARKLRLEF